RDSRGGPGPDVRAVLPGQRAPVGHRRRPGSRHRPCHRGRARPPHRPGAQARADAVRDLAPRRADRGGAVARILIAEDEPGIASFLEKGRRAAGYTTLVVEDGRTAAHAARDDDFDLVILDLGLPLMDGHEVLAEIRGRGERPPVLILPARTGVPRT